MVKSDCGNCLIRDLHELRKLVEKRIARKLPEEVSKPLFEAKKQMRVAFRGAVRHIITGLDEKQKGTIKSRNIELE